MKIVFFGTSENSVILLNGLVPLFEIVGIVTTPDSKTGRKQILTPSLVAQYTTNSEALKNIPIFKPEKLKDPEFLSSLKTLDAELFVVLSYGKILPLEVINLPPLKTINIHPSLLPLYRGATPMPSALANGETITGNTIIVMDEQMDHGPILAQRQIPIEPDETYFELEEKLALDSVDLVSTVVPKYAAGEITPQEQNHDLATYTGMIQKSDGQVNWENSAQEIYNNYRAFVRWPGIWTTWNNEIFKILKCQPAEGTHSEPIGTVVENGVIACGNKTLLQLQTVQKAGKSPTDIKSFLNGNKDFTGSILK